MPRRKKVVEAEKPEVVEEKLGEPKADAELTEKAKVEVFEPKPTEEKLPKGMVKVRVKTGTLGFEGGTYEEGDVFTVSRKRLKGFDPRFYEIV